MNGIPRPTTTATPAADPNSDRDPIPFGYSGSPYTQHPQPQSYVPHQMVPETFSPQQTGPQQAPRNIFEVAAQNQAAVQQQQVIQQPQQAQSHYHAAPAPKEQRRLSPELALAIANVTGLSPEDCSASIDLLREITKLLPPQRAQQVAFLLVSIAVELDRN